MPFIFISYSFPFLGAIMVSLVGIGLIWRKRNVPGRQWMILSMLSILIWNLFAMLEISSMGLANKILWAKLGYLGANTTAPLFLLFFLNYPSAKFHFSKFQVSLFFVLPLVTILMVMTNEWHYLFWTGFTPSLKIYNSYLFGHGPFYWLALTYNYLCGTGIVVLILSNMMRFTGLYRFQSFFLLFASVFPFATGIIYSFGFNPFPGLDILPIAFSLAGLIIVINIIFLRMFDLVPLGRNILVENMRDGVIVINRERYVVDINPAAQLFLYPVRLEVGDSIDQLDDPIKDCFGRPSSRVEIKAKNPQLEWFEINTNPLLDQAGNILGMLAIFHDTNEQKKAEEIMRVAVEKASVIAERQRIQRELHDLLTQNIYSLQLFARGGQDYAKNNDWEQARSSFQDIVLLSSQALKDLRLLLFQLKDDSLNEVGLLEALALRLDIVERRANIHTRLEADLPQHIPGDIQAALYSIAVEALNNSLKYAGASSLMMKVHQRDDSLCMDIQDDGKGFDPDQVSASHGFGLKNMSERVKQMGGEFKWVSSPGAGTLISVAIPCLLKEVNHESTDPDFAG